RSRSSCGYLRFPAIPLILSRSNGLPQTRGDPQGWFCAYAQHRVEIYEGGDVRTHMYPHGPTVGRDIAAITKAAMRAQDITNPGRELRFRAWMSLQPQGLQAFRLGLEWDEREVHDR
ncbi:hypothetical protein, partial [Nocardia sp. NPDC051981]|uniref:hypothetical protein n=1 Tax=Nocardia sp. NPDC051981 TaxID=3155417 RepID=UPI00343CEBE2